MDVVQVVIQGGAVGVAVYAIYALQKLLSNHLGHNTRAMNGLAEAVRNLIEYLKEHRMK